MIKKHPTEKLNYFGKIIYQNKTLYPVSSLLYAVKFAMVDLG